MHKPVMQFEDCLIYCVVRTTTIPHFQNLWTPILIKLPYLTYFFAYEFCPYVYFDM